MWPRSLAQVTNRRLPGASLHFSFGARHSPGAQKMPNEPFSGSTDFNPMRIQPGSPSFLRKDGLVAPFLSLPITLTGNTLKGKPPEFPHKELGSPASGSASLGGQKLRTPRPSNLSGPAPPSSLTSLLRHSPPRRRRDPSGTTPALGTNYRSPCPQRPSLGPAHRKKTRSTTAANRSFPHKPRYLVPPTPSPPLQLGPTRLLTQRHINFVEVFITADFRRR